MPKLDLLDTLKVSYQYPPAPSVYQLWETNTSRKIHFGSNWESKCINSMFLPFLVCHAVNTAFSGPQQQGWRIISHLHCLYLQQPEVGGHMLGGDLSNSLSAFQGSANTHPIPSHPMPSLCPEGVKRVPWLPVGPQ